MSHPLFDIIDHLPTEEMEHFIPPEGVDASTYFGTDGILAAIYNKVEARGIATSLYNRLRHFPANVQRQWHVLFPRFIDVIAKMPRYLRADLKLSLYTPGHDVYAILSHLNEPVMAFYICSKDTAPVLPQGGGIIRTIHDGDLVDIELIDNLKGLPLYTKQVLEMVVGYVCSTADKLGEWQNVSRITAIMDNESSVLVQRSTWSIAPLPEDVVGEDGLTPYKRAVKRGFEGTKDEWYDYIERNPSIGSIREDLVYGVITLRTDGEAFWSNTPGNEDLVNEPITQELNTPDTITESLLDDDEPFGQRFLRVLPGWITVALFLTLGYWVFRLVDTVINAFG